ncbi:hypothetical protein SAMN05444920_11811 [Nonomuraea solani]|uniref:Uncharacterized protein n=1 Tax=Nonomuraea solani TaxID=1144553 RepID=A0A1H6ESN8_9ACTN|nr:hypothetical protein [Nonomuraea solani]SEH00822.1 hypothetical protein SAMN05444920_11811 [Nonomuraea solani]
MARVIELRPAEEAPESLTLRTGDLLMVWATGGRIRSGTDSLELLGPFLIGVLGIDGLVHTPEGPPGKVALLARRPGRAEIEFALGGPWPAIRWVTMTFVVE